MLLRTHIVIAVFLILVLFRLNGDFNFSFIAVFLIASAFPDIDIRTSKLGSKKFFRPLQVFLSHRGFLHSFSFLIPVSLLIYFFAPVFFVPIAGGYSLHLLVDVLTVKGIQFFYPFGKRISWKLKTGSRTDTFLFILFSFLDLIFLLKSIVG